MTNPAAPTTTLAKRRSSLHDIPRSMWGMMIVVPAIFLLGAGVKAWIAAAQNPAPTVVTYEEFVRRQPKSGWYTITGGTVDAMNAVYWEQNGVCVDVYAPLRPGQNPFGGGFPGGVFPGGTSNIYIEVDDSPTLGAFQDRTYARHNGGEAGAAQYTATHRDRFEQRRDVSGLVYYGHRDPQGAWSKAGLDASRIIFLADGWKPNYIHAYGGTGFGAAFTLLSLYLMGSDFLRRRL